MVEVDDAELVARLLIIHIGQLGHDLERGGLGLGLLSKFAVPCTRSHSPRSLAAQISRFVLSKSCL